MANSFESLLARLGPLLARVMLAQLFIVSGTGKLFNYTKMATYLFNRSLPVPEALLLLVIVVEIGGGLLLVTGFKARWAAAALFAFTLFVSVVIHAFWAAEPARMTAELNEFMKNAAIMGGLFYVLVFGAGPLSVDSALAAKRPPVAPPRKR